ncbi:hypothetical protein BH10ACI2_BH10ACI2_07110 [soil metagenome]
MNKNMKKVFLLLVLLSTSPDVYAQQTVAASGSPGEDRRVVNEDRGNAYIITANTQPPLSKMKGMPKLPRQFSVFLGDGWNRDELRILEPSLANLFANPFGLSTELVEATMNKNDQRTGLFVEVPFSSSTGRVTDLQIQQQMQSIADSDLRSSLSGRMVVMVYLDTSLHSRLTDLEGGKHYLAYENTVNINGNRIRYAVVPMDVNPKHAETIAQTAFLCAIVDP